ncbi:hypothetical protein ACFQ9X_18890 [Catenulispora yoronensis]
MNGALATSVLVGVTGMDTAGVYGEGGMGGTSVAAPEFSALQADAKQAAGHAVGFANPALYGLSGSSAFHDVTAHPAGLPQVIEGVHVSTVDPSRGCCIGPGRIRRWWRGLGTTPRPGSVRRRTTTWRGWVRWRWGARPRRTRRW